MAWLLVVRELERVIASNGTLTWAAAEAAVRKADPVAHASVLALGSYTLIGRSQRREETYQRSFRQTYVNEAMGGSRR
jgi:hypothetical protein